MIIRIDALNRDRFEAVLDEMFRLRARVFGERLGWDVDIRDGQEVDEFDSLDPTYLVGLDEEGHVVSCARLMQTTGPHMLADVFSSILDGEPPLRSSRLWEASRLCVDTRRLKARGGARGISRATCELLIAGNDYAVEAGVSDLVAVIDPGVDRVMRRPACAPYDYVGTRKPMGKVDALAALVACSEERSRAMRAFAGIEGDVFLGEDEALALVAGGAAAQPEQSSNVIPFPAREPARARVTTGDVLEYCIGLIRAARGDEERQQAYQVAREFLAGMDLSEDAAALARALSPRPPLNSIGG